MPRFFLERLVADKPNFGIFIVPQQAAIGEIIESLLLVWTASLALPVILGEFKSKPETTRPSGAQSYAQHISTSAWATLALIRTAAN